MQRNRSHSHYPVRAAVVAVSFLLLVVLVMSGCGGSTSTSGGSNATAAPPVTLNVFAAASLQAAFTKIGSQFHTAHSNVTVTFNFGGSDALATQITQGAPADVFASANNAQLNVVVKGGDIDGGNVKTFAHNRLVVVYPKANPAKLSTLQDLAKPGIKLVLAAKTVPVGGYALDFLTKASVDSSFGASYKTNVLKNVVSYEADVKSVLAKITLGEADAGIVYTTDAQTAADSTATLAIPDALNSIATYPIAIVKASKNAATAQQFVDYVAGSDGQAVLAQYGFVAGSSGPQYQPAS